MTHSTAFEPHWSRSIETLGACSEAVRWARGYPSLRAAWAACERGDWMLWLAAALSGGYGSATHRRLVLAACACARTALHLVAATEDRPRVAIETAERWARRDRGVTRADVYGAARASALAAADAAWTAGAGAAVAAEASRAARAAAETAVGGTGLRFLRGAAEAAGASGPAAERRAAGTTEAAWTAGAAAMARCADLVREHYPTPPAAPRRGARR